MGPSRIFPSTPGWIVGLLIIVFLIAGMVARSSVSTNSAEAGEIVPVDELALNIAYLADPQQPHLDLDQVRKAGITVTSSAAELQRLGEQADGIMIDRTMLAAVDHDWLVAQRMERKLIVGVNVPFNQLAAATEYPIPANSSYVQEWPGKTFYSFLWRVEQGKRMREASGSDFVRDTIGLLGVVDSGMDDLLAARTALSTIQPTPTGALPRPSTR